MHLFLGGCVCAAAIRECLHLAANLSSQIQAKYTQRLNVGKNRNLTYLLFPSLWERRTI